MTSRREFLHQGTRYSVAAWCGAKLAAPGRIAEQRRVRDVALRIQSTAWDAGSGRVVQALSYNGRIPGPTIEARQGDLLRVTVTNETSEPSTVHWHGIPVPFAMDGVPDLTQAPIAPGAKFTYEFPVDVAGTYWYHSHFAYQFERGLFGALIVAPRADDLSYDREYTLVLDDWLHDPLSPVPSVSPYNSWLGGVFMGSMQMRMDDFAGIPDSSASPSTGTRGMTGHGTPMREPVFDAYTMNGLTGAAHPALAVRRGERVRLRFINASTATVFPVYVAGHPFTVTHLDGQAVAPFETDVFPVGMGERVDVLITASNPGAWRLASTEPRHGRRGFAFVVRYDGVRPDAAVADAKPTQLKPRPYAGIVGAREVVQAPSERTATLSLQQSGPSVWTINGRAYPDTVPIDVRRGERVRLRITNNSPYAHPVHLHGHFFDVVRPYGATADVARPLRKDTITLYHMDDHVIEFTADNPGPRWFLHCHNQYHHVGGMATEVRYV